MVIPHNNLNKRTRKIALAMVSLCATGNVLAKETESYNYLGGLELGYKYQEMEADTIRNVYVKTVGLNLLEVEWKPAEASWAKSLGWANLLLPRLRYEVTPGSSSEQDKIAQLSKNEKDEGWTRFVADIEIDPMKLIGKGESQGRIITSYDVQTFLVSVQATQEYFYIQDHDAQLMVAGDYIDVNTTFKEAALGYRFIAPSNTFYTELGLFNIDYEKPVSSDVSMPMESIYKANFSASGIYAAIHGELGAFSLGLRYDYGYNAEADVDGGVSLTRDEYGYEDEITYTSYRIELEYDLEKSSVNLPISVGFNYIDRSFGSLLDDQVVNDDRIFGISLKSRFVL